MKRTVQLLAVLAALIPQAAPAADLDTIVLEKSSDWVLDYAEERCSLTRSFGVGDNSVTLQIDSYGKPYVGQFLIYGQAVPASRLPFVEIGFRYSSDAEIRHLAPMHGTINDQNAITFVIPLGPIITPAVDRELAQMTTADRNRQIFAIRDEFENDTSAIVVEWKRSRKIVELKTGRLSAPLKALRDCVANLQQSWGIDLEREGRLQRAAQPLQDTVRKVQASYPYDMRRAGRNAFIPVRVMVDANGKATQCVVQTKGPPKDFLDAVCEGLSRDFDPALDENGQPVASIFTTFIIYSSG